MEIDNFEELKKEVQRRTDQLIQRLSEKNCASCNVFQYMYEYYIQAIDDMNLDSNTTDKLKHYFVYQHLNPMNDSLF